MICQSCRHFYKKLTFLGFRFHCRLHRRAVEPMFRCADYAPAVEVANA